MFGRKVAMLGRKVAMLGRQIAILASIVHADEKKRDVCKYGCKAPTN